MERKIRACGIGTECHIDFRLIADDLFGGYDISGAVEGGQPTPGTLFRSTTLAAHSSFARPNRTKTRLPHNFPLYSSLQLA